MTKELKKRPIRFGDVVFDRKARERINNILISGRNTEGMYVEKFESMFAKKFGFEHAIMTSSGTTAAEVLWMAVAAERAIKPQCASVITPALAFGSTANALDSRGFYPYMVDIEPHLNMQVPPGDPWSIMDSPIGVQFVANMGRMIGVDAVFAYAKFNDLFFAIDACEGHGGEFEGVGVSGWADAAIYSFYPAHIITCGGEGGMICTRDRRIADLCRSIKSHGRPPRSIKHDFQVVGTNAKTTEFAAAVGISELDKFDETFKRRREIRAGLIERLKEFSLVLYPDADGEVIAPHAFPVLTQDLAGLSSHLREWTIEFKSLWGALSNHAAYSRLGISAGYFGVAENVGAHGLHFGCHQSLSDDDLDYIRDVFKLFFKGE
jgi:perosamine synthetase